MSRQERTSHLPIAARIKFKAFMFAYKTTTGSAPLYLNSVLQTYVASRSLRSTSVEHIIVPSQIGTKSLSLTFSLTVASWWNNLPNSIRANESLAIFKKRLKHISSIFIWPSNSSTLYSNSILCICLLYIYAFRRCFYPKRLTLHPGYTCFVYVFPGNWTHNLLRC